MRVVAALGGNALLERGEKPDEDIQEHHVQQAVAALALLARSEDLVVTHGNGPQVGMLALESASARWRAARLARGRPSACSRSASARAGWSGAGLVSD